MVLGDRPDDQDRHSGDRRIAEDAWQPIKYPQAVYDEAEQRWVSDAEVAEVGFVAFTGRRRPNTSPAVWSCAASNGSNCSPPTAASNKS